MRLDRLFIVTLAALVMAAPAVPDGHYVYAEPSPDGIGKFYMGREISRVMGHLGAGWLERPSREREERTDLLLDRLPLSPDSIVADIGAGTGYFSMPIASRLNSGRVIAVDIQQEMLDIIDSRRLDAGIDNIELVLATETDPGLPPGTVDLALIVDAYHEFSHPLEVMLGIAEGLKPGGQLWLLEYRAEDPRVPIKPLHKMSAAQAIREVEAAGLSWVKTLDFLPQQHVLVFEKPPIRN